MTACFLRALDRRRVGVHTADRTVIANLTGTGRVRIVRDSALTHTGRELQLGRHELVALRLGHWCRQRQRPAVLRCGLVCR